MLHSRQLVGNITTILLLILVIPIHSFASIPHTFVGLVSKAVSLDELGNHSGSISLLKQALSLHPLSIWQRVCILNNLALAFQYSNPQLSLKYIDKALALDGTSSLSLYNKAYLLQRFNQISASIPFYEHVLRLANNPEVKNATLNLEAGLQQIIWQLAHKKQYHDISPYIDKYLQSKPTSVWALTTRGAILVALHNNTGALQYLHKAWSLAKTTKDKATILDNMGIVLDNLNDSIVASNYFDKALKLNPTDYFAMYNYGITLAKSGNITGSIFFS
jgi:tetratricopeptide (TPR) repeat protein